MNEELAKERLEKVRAEISSKGLDGLCMFHTEDLRNYSVRYLSGFSGSTAVLLISAQETFIIVDSRYVEQVEKEVVGFEGSIHLALCFRGLDPQQEWNPAKS